MLVLAVLSIVSCQGDLSRPTYLGCPVPGAYPWYAYPWYSIPTVLSWPSCHGFLIPIALFLPPCSVHLALSFLSYMYWPDRLFRLSCPGYPVMGYPVLAVLSQLSCPSCPVLGFLFKFSCPDNLDHNPVPAVLLGFLFPAVVSPLVLGSVIFVLSRLICQAGL